MRGKKFDSVNALRAIIKRSPTRTRDEHWSKWFDFLEAKGHDQYRADALQRLFSIVYNTSRSQVFPTVPGSRSRKVVGAQRSPETKKVAADEARLRATNRNHARFLDSTLPNGKQMRYCTGTYLKTLGGGYVRVGRRVGHHAVGDVVNEREVSALMRGPQ